MEDLFELLTSVNNIIKINYSCPGFTINQTVKIVSVKKLQDGLVLYTNNGGEIFISSIICKLIEKSEDDESLDFYFKSECGGLCHISFPKIKAR